MSPYREPAASGDVTSERGPQMRNGPGHDTRLRRRVLAATAVLGLSAGALALAAPASAAPADAVLGHTCLGSSPEFTIIANGAIPQNATWTMTVSEQNSQTLQFEASVSSPLVEQTTLSKTSIRLTAAVALSSGTVVTIQPYYYYIPATGTTPLTLSGYGGSETLYAGVSSGTCG
jgi:hypothetical protein